MEGLLTVMKEGIKAIDIHLNEYVSKMRKTRLRR